MAGTSSVPRPTFGPLGFVIPTEGAILTGVDADMNAAFGGNLNTGTSDGSPTNPTPQGQLASSLTAIVGDKNSIFLKYTQQVDPAYADGRMQDGIARIYFITRNPALATVVTATCGGQANVKIPAGALARATDGTQYICTSGGTIPIGGTIDLEFAANVTGPIACPTGTLTEISRAVSGWDTITNAADGVVGTNVESRTAFEARRGQSVAKNARGSISSILGAVLDVDGVIDAYAVSNDTAGSVTIGGVSIGAYSLYVAAIGGTDLAVATAIFTKKMPGGPYYASANTTVTVLDTNPIYVYPIPSYTVKFYRPAALPIFLVITIANTTAVPADALAQIQAAILAAFAGADGGSRARIGQTVFASRYYAPIAALGSWAEIISVQVGTSSGNANSVTVAINQVAVTSNPNISLVLV